MNSDRSGPAIAARSRGSRSTLEGREPARTDATPIDRVIRALEPWGVRSCGEGKWESRCPCHKGSRRNLSIDETSDGTVRIHCFHDPKCPPEAILAELSLTLRDLFPGIPKKSRARTRQGGATFKTAAA